MFSLDFYRKHPKESLRIGVFLTDLAVVSIIVNLFYPNLNSQSVKKLGKTLLDSSNHIRK